MDELELAKRAIRRNLLTEEQLREAQDYAQGGRPLLSVLLDLGFLKPDDLPAIFVPLTPEASASPRKKWVSLIPLLAGIPMAVIIGIMAFWRLDPPAPPRPPPPPRPILVREEAPPLGERLAARADEYLADAEGRDGSLPHQVRERLARAAALYEEAIRERPGDARTRLKLGRSRELLDQWEVALQIFRQVLDAHPDDGQALVGSARCQLLLQRHEGARADADRACSVAPHAEAFLVRGRALLSLGYRDAARRDLLEARRLDPSLGVSVGEILGRLR